MQDVKCRNCSLYKGNKSNCVLGDGSKTPIVVFIGEALGELEDEKGIVFCGKSGNLLRRRIDAAGFQYKDYYITNCVKCRPPNNRNPSRKEIEACAPHLFKEIQETKPLILVTLGEVATSTILGKEGIGILRGRFHWSDTYSCWVFPMYHPAAILRNPSRQQIMDDDLKLLKNFIAEKNFKREEKPKEKYGDYVLVQDKEGLSGLYKKICKAGLVFFDLETNGLDVFAPDLEVRSASFTIEKKFAYVIPWGILNKSMHEEAVKFTKLIMEDERIKKAAQNMNFDAKVLKVKYSITTNNWWFDTMIGHALVIPIRGIHNQHAMLNEYIRSGRIEECAEGYDERVRAVGGAHKLPLGTELWEYNAMDSMTGFAIMECVEEDLNKKNQMRLFRELLMEVADDLMDMEVDGMKFDALYIEVLDKEYEQEMERLRILMETDPGIIEFERRYGKQFNPRTFDNVVWLLFDYYGLTPIKYTTTNKPSVNKEVLAVLANQNKYCKYATDYRRLDKARSTYLSGLLPKLYDGISHTNFNLSVTATGRLSSGVDKDSKYGHITTRAFNTQNIPRDKKIRRIMIARENCILVAGDLSQAELRCMAAISRDEALTKVVMSGDAHRAMASEVYSVPFTLVTKMQRSVGKNLNFGIIYGIGPEALAEDLSVATGNTWTFDDAAALIDTVAKKFPSVSKWKQFVEWHIKKFGYVESPLGRRRYFEIKDSKEIREGVNQPIQSVASDFTLIGVIQTNRILKKKKIDAKLINEVHDQIVGETWNINREVSLKVKEGGEILVSKEAYELAMAIREGMANVCWPNSGEKFDWLTVPLVVDVSVGFNMGEMIEVEV